MSLMEEEGGSVHEMEKDFDSKLKIESNSSSSNNSNASVRSNKSFAFRAPQENFNIQDFEQEKIYGVGSYSKVQFFFLSFALFFQNFFFSLFSYCIIIYLFGFFLFSFTIVVSL